MIRKIEDHIEKEESVVVPIVATIIAGIVQALIILAFLPT
jgi:hypothetical protein